MSRGPRVDKKRTECLARAVLAAVRPVLTDDERKAMLHALGLTPWGSGKMHRWAYRNRVQVSTSSEDHHLWLTLVMRKLAHPVNGTTTWFYVSKAGVEALGPEIKRRVPLSLRGMYA